MGTGSRKSLMPEFAKPGDPLPRIEVRRAGAPFEFQLGRSGLVLFFMRAADCSVCRAHVRQLTLLAPDLEGVGFSVGVVVPEEGRDVEVERTLRTPFAVASGVGAHASIGLKRAFLSLVQQSGTLVVNEKRTVTHINRSTLPTGALDIELLKALATKR